nr:serine/threonine-protein phosphatase 7 long form homolog [Aegilops tauschii subsp. strangulata]
MVWLLDDVYDTKHRAYMMREKEMAGLLPWIQLVSRSTPNLNASLVSALADRWRPETHGFHLQTGDMTVTLEDVSLITGLAIDGRPLCMSTDSNGWREQMIALIDMAPTEAEADVEEGEEKKKRERKAAGAAFTWIQNNFATCPADATDDVIQTHARVYMCYVVSRTLFPDSTGKNAPWMCLKALTVFNSKWSWGSATLAYLYRQLDDACCMIADSAGIGGNMLLLSVWSWERLPVGRPKSVRFNPWYEDEDDELRRPTWAYKWDVVSEMMNDVNLMYQKYIAELDTSTPEQFGLFQPHPLEWVDTDKALHRLDRRRQRKIKDGDKHHASYVTRFQLCMEQARSSARAQLREHNPLAFYNYIRWLLENTRVEICLPAYNEDILEEPVNFEDLSKEKYNRDVRVGQGVPAVPRTEIKKAADESQSILEKTPVGKGNDVGSLRAFLKGHELDDDMTLADAQARSAYMLKPRQPIRRYTPTDFDNRGNPKVVVGTSRMASLDDEAEAEAEEEVQEEEARPPRKKKISCRRGTRNTRGRH